MKNLSILFILLLGVFCMRCTTPKNDNEFILDEPLAILVDSFIRSNPDRNRYELYFDKKGIQLEYIFLYGGDRSMTETENAKYLEEPLIKIYSDKTPVYIYSGAERYLEEPEEQREKQPQISSEKKLNNGVCWLISDSAGILTIKKGALDIYPFSIPLFIINGNAFY